jgi:hypothetical protein
MSSSCLPTNPVSHITLAIGAIFSVSQVALPAVFARVQTLPSLAAGITIESTSNGFS